MGNRQIIVAGDVYVDWLMFETNHTASEEASGAVANDSKRKPAWQSEPQVIVPAVHSGAWLCERFLRMMLPLEYARNVLTYKRYEHPTLRAGNSEHVLHQINTFELFDTTNLPHPTQTYRARLNSSRFFGPLEGDSQLYPILLPADKPFSRGDLTPFENFKDLAETVPETETSESYFTHTQNVMGNAAHFDPQAQRTIVIYDCGNGFAKNKNRYAFGSLAEPQLATDRLESWKYLFVDQSFDKLHEKLKNANGTDDAQHFAFAKIEHVYLCLKNISTNLEKQADSASFLAHPIVNFLNEHEMLDKTSIVLSANDLRSAGALISSGTSWERTADDINKLFDEKGLLHSLANAKKVAVRIGLSGIVVRYKTGSSTKPWLVYDPVSYDQEYVSKETSGTVFPLDAVTLATMVARDEVGYSDEANEEDPRNCLQTFCCSLSRCRSFYDHGWLPPMAERSEIEAWDRCNKLVTEEYSEPAGRTLRQVSVLGKFEGQEETKGEIVLKYNVYIDNATEFDSLIHDNATRKFIAKTISHTVFDGRLKPALATAKSSVPELERDLIEILIASEHKEKAMRSDSPIVMANVKISFAEMKTKPELCNKFLDGLYAEAEKQKVDLSEELRNEITAFRTEDAVQDFSGSIAVLRKLALAIVSHFHIAASNDSHQRWFAPMLFLDDQQTRFSSFKIESLENPSSSILPTGEKELQGLARDLVLCGFNSLKSTDGKKFPVARFNSLNLVDREEIEDYRGMNRLLRNYLKRSKVDRPLCAAVFGPPGSGKSFGVTQLALSCGVKKSDILEYNLSQFREKKDLERALIHVHDVCRPGHTPLVFFDEFDSSLAAEPLGWLKMFLSVMQDGTFSLDGDLMRLGKSIFIFAGGTCDNFQLFSTPPNKQDENAHKVVPNTETYKKAKVPDFVSRLRGYINIKGINPPDESGLGFSSGKPITNPKLHLIRRAAIIRSIVERDYPELLGQNGSGSARIDVGVLDALLQVPRYAHGARSLSAIFDMSNLANKRRFDRSMLPSKNQLAMLLACNTEQATPAEEFMEIVSD